MRLHPDLVLGYGRLEAATRADTSHRWEVTAQIQSPTRLRLAMLPAGEVPPAGVYGTVVEGSGTWRPMLDPKGIARYGEDVFPSALLAFLRSLQAHTRHSEPEFAAALETELRAKTRGAPVYRLYRRVWTRLTLRELQWADVVGLHAPPGRPPTPPPTPEVMFAMLERWAEGDKDDA